MYLLVNWIIQMYEPIIKKLSCPHPWEGLYHRAPTPQTRIIIRRPCVTRAREHLCYLLVHYIFFLPMSKYLQKLFNSQTITARNLTFWGNVHHLLCVICHMSAIRYQMSGVNWYVSPNISRHNKCNRTFALLWTIPDKVLQLTGLGPIQWKSMQNRCCSAYFFKLIKWFWCPTRYKGS